MFYKNVILHFVECLAKNFNALILGTGIGIWIQCDSGQKYDGFLIRTNAL